MEPFHFNSTVSLLLLLVALSFLFEVFPINALGQCLQTESSALLQLKRGFTSSTRLETWRPGTDCCTWEGVTCDDESRRVIGLNLGNRFIAGKIDPSLFNLTSLRTLDFSDNQFDGIPIPDSGWDRLANLSRLYLLNAGFAGKVPAAISRLSKLTFLYLSENLRLSLTAYNPLFFQNMSSLRILYLDGVNISAYGDEWCGALVNSTPVLETLSCNSCSLFGGFPKQIFQLRNLKSLDISNNSMLSGPLPDFPKDNNLVVLSIFYTSFSGNLPDTIGNLKLLKILDLSGCRFSGRIPASLMGNLSQLEWLDLSYNNFSGVVELEFIKGLKNLEGLDLSNSGFSLSSWDADDGSSWSSNFSNLLSLRLVGCNLTKIPAFIKYQHHEMCYLNLSNNPMLSGPLPDFPKDNNLEILDLSDTNFSGNLPDTIGNLKFLSVLDLSGCRFSGRIPSLMGNLSQLDWLDLSNNNLSGVLELEFIKDLKNLEYLDLSNNGFSSSSWGADDGSSWSSNFSKMSYLYLAGCNLTKIPAFIKYQHQLQILDLSNNIIHGEIHYLSNNKIPPFIYNLTELRVLDLSNNRLTGSIPLSFCNFIKLRMLDLSNNRLGGSIPPCLLEEGINLNLLNLRGNQLHGAIPNEISPKCELEAINLRDNQLEGLLPRSMSNCRSLVVLDLGNNNLKDTFPYWLGNMSSLRVLVLRSNKFHGLVGPPNGNHETDYTFPMLHVFDISSNNFSGNLCAECFSNFKSMMINKADTTNNLTFHSFHNYYDLVILTIINKGQLMTIQKFWMVIKSIDFSNNLFEGEIPTAIGQLVSLQVLNMSHNYLTSKIPPQLGNLSQLESLDLSMNSLSGTIPQELISLYFLSCLNLSYNKLVGKIPLGGQFCTFPNTSFEGNEGLHWLPCNTLAPVVNNTSTSPPGFGGTENRSYMIVLGILFGMGFGVGMATVVVLDVMCYDKCMRRRSRRHIHR